jgi:hypothetical protein
MEWTIYQESIVDELVAIAMAGRLQLSANTV